MKKFVVVAAALAASGVVHAEANSQVAVQKKAPVASKNRVASTTLRQRAPQKRLKRVAAIMPSANAAISERPSSSQTSESQNIRSSQSSATRVAIPAATSTVEATKPGPKMIPVDNFKFATNVYYYGSSVASPLESRVPDFHYGYLDQQSEAVSAEVHFSAGYKFHPNYTFSLNPQFNIVPSQVVGEKNNENHFMKPIASYFKLAVGKITSYKNFTWNGDLRLHPGITDDLKGTPMYFRSGQNFIFKLSKTSTFAFYNTLRYYHRTQTALNKGWEKFNSGDAGAPPYSFRYTLSPTIEHQLSDKVGMAISYNIDNRLTDGGNIFSASDYNHEADGTYFEAGPSLDLIPNLNLNPYVDVYTRRPNFYGTRWGINVAWTIL